jgi:predicted GIY-YIG superfamily endonuclease
MVYVYILKSTVGAHHYVGMTADLKDRVSRHNAGEVAHTSKYAPWTLSNYFAFRDESKAHAFEKYLKSGSGRAFAKRHF